MVRNFQELGFSPSEISSFLDSHQIVAATTTPHKVGLMEDFFGAKLLCHSAPNEPSSWARPEEIAIEKVNQVATSITKPGPFLIIGTDVVICFNGDISPLGKLHGTEEDVWEKLRQTIGPNPLNIGLAELQVGAAAYSTRHKKGVYGKFFLPFQFTPLSEKQIQTYLKKHPEKVSKTPGGVAFADSSLTDNIINLRGVSKKDPCFPQELKRFQQFALGFPQQEVNRLLQALAGNNSKNEWTKVFISH